MIELRTLMPHPDNRGAVREMYRRSWFPGVPPVVQLVQSDSTELVLRAMHAHKRQYDIWHFTAGIAQVQLYDHRTGDHEIVIAGRDTTLVIPPGVSHGFLSLTPVTLVYALTEEYDGSDEFGWDAFDPGWPGAREWKALPMDAVRSQRDLSAPSLRDFADAW